VHLLIPAAGSGRRMKAGKNKLLISLRGESLLYWTLKSVFQTKGITWVGIIGQPYDKDQIIKSIKEFSQKINWIDGGETRQESVRNGLNCLPPDASKVLIHDGARCLIQSELIAKCACELKNNDAIVLAIKVTDTIKVVNPMHYIEKTPDRNTLWAAQTPQGFSVNKLKQAHEEALKKNWIVTDDASLFEMLKWPVKVIEGNPQNIKITSPLDLKIADLFLNNY
tara:strand:- start:5423 stop:6094 length:672 start_codon:yes stop_codon:yes gene_type:complete